MTVQYNLRSHKLSNRTIASHTHIGYYYVVVFRSGDNICPSHDHDCQTLQSPISDRCPALRPHIISHQLHGKHLRRYPSRWFRPCIPFDVELLVFHWFFLCSPPLFLSLPFAHMYTQPSATSAPITLTAINSVRPTRPRRRRSSASCTSACAVCRTDTCSRIDTASSGVSNMSSSTKTQQKTQLHYCATWLSSACIELMLRCPVPGCATQRSAAERSPRQMDTLQLICHLARFWRATENHSESQYTGARSDILYSTSMPVIYTPDHRGPVASDQ